MQCGLLKPDRNKESRLDDWRFSISEFNVLVESTCLCGRTYVDLFTCGDGPGKGSSTYPIFHSKLENAFKYSWVETSFHGIHEYTVDYIARTLQKTVSQQHAIHVCDTRIEERSVVLTVGAVVGGEIHHGDIIKFRAHLEAPMRRNPIILHGLEGGHNHVFTNQTSSLVIVVIRSKLTVPAINPSHVLHAMLGHIATFTAKAVVCNSFLQLFKTFICSYPTSLAEFSNKLNARIQRVVHKTRHGWKAMLTRFRWSPLTLMPPLWKHHDRVGMWCISPA